MVPKFPGFGPLADEAIDLVIVTATLLLLLRLLRRSRARLALVGVVLIGFVDLAARQLGLALTAWLFQGLFLIAIVVLLLAFQDDLKRLFERLAVWGLRREPAPQGDTVVDTVVRAASALAAARHGALIVFRGREPLDRHLTGGIALDGSLSEPLLLSLFDPHSPGHDGAAVFEGRLIRRFGVHLPLSADLGQLGPVGTRHAAALGLAERCDAFVVVVSEERGTIGFASGGRLRFADVAVTVDALLAQLGRRTFDVPPQSVHVPPGVTVRSVNPERVTLELERSPSR